MGTDIMELSHATLNIIWIILFIVLLLIELFTVGLTTIWFAIGALAAAAANTLGAGLIVQIIVFLVISVILLIFTRPLAAKHLNKKRIKTNYESKIGEIIRITEKVDNINQSGKSVVDGQEWTVRTKTDSEILEKGDLAKIVSISGVKLIVEKYQEEAS